MLLFILICIIVVIIALLKAMDIICNSYHTSPKLTSKEQSYMDWNIRNGRDTYDGTSHGNDYHSDRY